MDRFLVMALVEKYEYVHSPQPVSTYRKDWRIISLESSEQDALMMLENAKRQPDVLEARILTVQEVEPITTPPLSNLLEHQELVYTYAVPRTFPLFDVKRVIDGDTLELIVDLGFGVRFYIRCRSARIDAPELNTPEGVAAKAWLEQQIQKAGGGSCLEIRCYGQDNYGRWLADLLVKASGVCLNDLMVQEGHAKPYKS